MDSFDSQKMKARLSVESAFLLEKLGVIQAGKVIIDLGKMDRLGSHEVVALIKLRHELDEQNVPLILRNLNAHLRNIFRIMQLEQIFILENSDDLVGFADNLLQPKTKNLPFNP